MKPKEKLPKIEQKFLRLLKRHGFPILLVRMDKEIRCHCYNEATGNTDPECDTCLGRGWTYTIHKHLAIDEVAATPESLPRLVRHHETGPMAVAARHFYLSSVARPSVQDIIALTQFDKLGRPISREMEIYKVGHVFAYRANEGKIIAYRVSATQDIVQTPIKSAILRGRQYWPRYR